MVDVLDGVVGPIGDVDVLGVVDSLAIVEFVVIVGGIPVVAALAEDVVSVDVGIDVDVGRTVDVVTGASVLVDGVVDGSVVSTEMVVLTVFVVSVCASFVLVDGMMVGVDVSIMPWSVDVVLVTVVVSANPLFKTFLTAFISGYLPCPQMPRKSSVSIDQNITPPNCKSFTKSAFRLILSTSS